MPTPSPTFRVKVCPPEQDCHYFYAPTLEEAERTMAELTRDLEGMGCSIYLYVETRHGHIRIR